MCIGCGSAARSRMQAFATLLTDANYSLVHPISFSMIDPCGMNIFNNKTRAHSRRWCAAILTRADHSPCPEPSRTVHWNDNLLREPREISLQVYSAVSVQLQGCAPCDCACISVWCARSMRSRFTFPFASAARDHIHTKREPISRLLRAFISPVRGQCVRQVSTRPNYLGTQSPQRILLARAVEALH